jgi:hypothetical protein
MMVMEITVKMLKRYSIIFIRLEEHFYDYCFNAEFSVLL